MTPNEYVLNVVNRYTAQSGDGSPAEQAAITLYPIIQAWGGQYLKQVLYSGSYAKSTAIAGGTDVDLFISMQSNTPEPLRGIYYSLADFVQGKGYTPKLRNVSMRVILRGIEVDLVPGKLQSPYTTDHSLFRRRANTWIKTNINTHINVVRNSNRVVEIKALKIWRALNGLDFPSFYLEMVVLEATRGMTIGNYSNNIMAVFEWIRDEIETAILYDPSNTNNVISDDLTRNERREIALQAALSRQARYWGNIIW